MRACLLISLMITFVACGKKTNEISFSKKSSSFISEKAIVIPHDEGNSVIRPKLLNKIVEKDFPATSSNPASTIHIHDELNKIELLESEIVDYEVKEKILTKVIVSFSDREEVYFVKGQVPAQDLILTLNLRPEVDRKLKLLSSPYNQTFNGATFYIVSVNHDDLMKNDQGFYSIESTISDFQEVFTIERFKSVLMKVDYDFMIQSLAPVVYTAPKIRCTKDLIEAGACGSGCSFTANLPVNKFEKVVPSNLQDIGVALKFSESLVKLDQLPIMNSKEGSFEVKIDSNDIAENKFSFQVIKMPAATYSGVSAHYNYSSTCNLDDRSKVSHYNQSTQVSVNIKMNVLGRGEELKKIKL